MVKRFISGIYFKISTIFPWVPKIFPMSAIFVSSPPGFSQSEWGWVSRRGWNKVTMTLLSTKALIFMLLMMKATRTSEDLGPLRHVALVTLTCVELHLVVYELHWFAHVVCLQEFRWAAIIGGTNIKSICKNCQRHWYHGYHMKSKNMLKSKNAVTLDAGGMRCYMTGAMDHTSSHK